jgi:hypothetical protein
MNFKLPITIALLGTFAVLPALAQQTSPELPKKMQPLPASAAAAKELEPLAFMAGRWIGVNPNNTVNEEHWTAPRGNHMVGTFHQVRRDGKPSFVEVSLISVEKEGVRLRLRHLHTGLEIPKGREEASDFMLKTAGNNRAEFYGTGKAAMVTSVVYRLVGKNQLVVETQFSPESKEKGFASVYFREGSKESGVK